MTAVDIRRSGVRPRIGAHDGVALVDHDVLAAVDVVDLNVLRSVLDVRLLTGRRMAFALRFDAMLL
jgi:hypothetical protein